MTIPAKVSNSNVQQLIIQVWKDFFVLYANTTTISNFVIEDA
jgi:hypothetical protein